jgi:hypothetical protein
MIHQNRILETMCRIRQLCTELEQVMGVAQQEGRMATLEETMQADQLSTELMELIGELPEEPCSRIESAAFRGLAITALKDATELLRRMIVPTTNTRTSSSPPQRAAAGRVRAYAHY